MDYWIRAPTRPMDSAATLTMASVRPVGERRTHRKAEPETLAVVRFREPNVLSTIVTDLRFIVYTVTEVV